MRSPPAFGRLPAAVLALSAVLAACRAPAPLPAPPPSHPASPLAEEAPLAPRSDVLIDPREAAAPAPAPHGSVP